MKQDPSITRARLKTPRAAAIAGILFSVLLLTSLILMRIYIPDKPEEAGDWLSRSMISVGFALNLVPFAGIAFLWFIGVVRDRLGANEDRFFSTVFLGSGLLFLAMLFTSAALAGGIISAYRISPRLLIESGVYTFGRTVAYEIMHVYTMRMAGVWMISTSTLSLRTDIIPRWMAYMGYVLALFLLLSMNQFYWAPIVFPLWVLLISMFILSENLGKNQKMDQAGVSGR